MADSDAYCPVPGRLLMLVATLRFSSVAGRWFPLAFPGEGASLEHDDLKHSRYPNHIQGLIPRIGNKAAPAPAITKIQDQVTGQLFFAGSGNISGKAFSFSGNLLCLNGTFTLCRDDTAGFSSDPGAGSGGSCLSWLLSPGNRRILVPPGSGCCGLVFNNDMRR